MISTIQGLSNFLFMHHYPLLGKQNPEASRFVDIIYFRVAHCDPAVAKCCSIVL